MSDLQLGFFVGIKKCIGVNSKNSKEPHRMLCDILVYVILTCFELWRHPSAHWGYEQKKKRIRAMRLCNTPDTD